jgi:hypothetical protein
MLARMSWRRAARPLCQVLAGVIGLGLLAGCTPSAEFVLHQPFAPPSQQVLKLTTERAYHAGTRDTQNCVLAFPLPGAVEGPRAFVMYIAAPNRTGTIAVSPHDPQGARGFLIQELGALAGRSDFAAGTVRYRRVPLAPRMRQLDVDIRTQDGAEIRGRAYLEDSVPAVESFEREFSADVGSLSTSQPAQTDAADDSGPPEEEK